MRPGVTKQHKTPSQTYLYKWIGILAYINSSLCCEVNIVASYEAMGCQPHEDTRGLTVVDVIFCDAYLQTEVNQKVGL